MAGRAIAGSLQRRVSELKAFIEFIDIAANEIRYCRTPVSRLLSNTARLCFDEETEDFELLVERQGSNLSFSDREILSEFKQLLGGGDVEGQQGLCRMTREQLCINLDRATQEERELSSLVKALSVAGAGILILLLI